ncbi:MAG: nitroreductase family protein [Butyricimonas paravirosa]
MDGKLSINTGTCIKCGKCARVCPSQIITQETKGSAVKVQNVENCIACGHCVAVCPTNSVLHSEFPPEKVHAFKYSDYPTPEQMMLVCKARRSNRAFSTRPIPREMLEQIIEAAHRAPTASNMQQVHFTLVTDPKQLNAISRFTLDVFNSAAKKLKKPILKPIGNELCRTPTVTCPCLTA